MERNRGCRRRFILRIMVLPLVLPVCYQWLSCRVTRCLCDKMFSFRAARRYSSAVSRAKKYSTSVEPQDPAAYCRELVRKHDYESFLISKFWRTGEQQDGYFAIKAFSVRLLTRTRPGTRLCEVKPDRAGHGTGQRELADDRRGAHAVLAGRGARHLRCASRELGLSVRV